MTNKLFLASVCFLLSYHLFSQGLMEVPLHTNPILVQKWNEQKKQKSVYIAPSIYDTLNIDTAPFLDDFSKLGPFPDTALWLDNFVFINRDYPIAPPTLGAATFDGVNQHGYPYNFLASQYSTGMADVLTSKRINLKGKTAADSIYLSFFYQPQGRGNAPESADSLILEFGKKTTAYKTIHDTTFVKDTLFSYDTVTLSDTIVSFFDTIGQIVDYVKPYDSVIWQERWAHFGYPLPANDSSWKFVILPVTDTAFLKGGFQFRFRNWATLSGNGDQWNIDYVYLKKNRNMYDSLFEDIAFVYDPPSLLKTFTAMPWNHYKTSYMRDSIFISLRNDYNTTKNVNFQYCLYDGNNNSICTPTPNASDNVDPFSTAGYYTYKAGSFIGGFLPAIPLLSDSATYKFEVSLNSTPDKDRQNDTVRTKQKFSNYYAYDDGSAESAFALGGTSMVLGELANQFISTIADTLRCIDIYFNPLWNDASLYSIIMKVWNDAGGQPNAEIYSDNINPPFSPQYDSVDYGPDHFIRYYLLHPLYLPASTFYVGFLQNTNQFLNVGVDKRTNNMTKVFYNTTGTWYTSPYPGSMMMRAVFGTAAEFTGIKNIQAADKSFSVYPNPANDKLFIKTNSANVSSKITYSIIDMYGSLISENKLNTSESIDISDLSNGVYFIRIKDEETISTNKFIKIK